MSVKRILLVLSGSVADGAAAHAAFHIAGRFGAQVDALHVEGDIADGLPYIELSLSEGALTREFAKARERQEGAAQWAREIFEAARREAGAEDGGVGWRTTRGRAADVVGSEGRVYDLTVIGAKADFAGASAGEVVTAALLETGHPVRRRRAAVPGRGGGGRRRLYRHRRQGRPGAERTLRQSRRPRHRGHPPTDRPGGRLGRPGPARRGGGRRRRPDDHGRLFPQPAERNGLGRRHQRDARTLADPAPDGALARNSLIRLARPPAPPAGSIS